MENAVLIQTDGTVLPVTISGYMEEDLAAALGAEKAMRCWSHDLVALGAACQTALMGYQDAKSKEKNLPVNSLAEKLIGSRVQGSFLLAYWDSNRMSWGAMEPQEVERAVRELEKRK